MSNVFSTAFEWGLGLTIGLLTGVFLVTFLVGVGASVLAACSGRWDRTKFRRDD
jgi:hypothetical protein